jgi:hypothetical protein
MRDWLTTILEVAGAASVCAGVFTFNLGAGLIASGIACLGLGYLGGRSG